VLEVGNGRRQFVLDKVDDTAVVVDNWLIRVQANRFVVTLKCEAVIALVKERLATIGIGTRVVRVKANCIVVILNRAVVVALVPIRVAAGDIDGGRAKTQANGLVVVLDSAVEFVLWLYAIPRL
jgi:hypothetical protein